MSIRVGPLHELCMSWLRPRPSRHSPGQHDMFVGWKSFAFRATRRTRQTRPVLASVEEDIICDRLPCFLTVLWKWEGYSISTFQQDRFCAKHSRILRRRTLIHINTYIYVILYTLLVIDLATTGLQCTFAHLVTVVLLATFNIAWHRWKQLKRCDQLKQDYAA